MIMMIILMIRQEAVDNMEANIYMINKIYI